MKAHLTVATAVVVLSALSHPASAQEPVGVVTAVAGPVMVARAAEAVEPLRFKDQIFLRDRVTTGDQAIMRLLLGGRVLVTARARSTLCITEVPGATTIDLASGRISVTVDRAKMRAGDLVEVRTPHAVVAVSSETLIVEVGYEGSTFTVLGGRVDVFRLDPVTGAAVEPATPVTAGEVVTVKGGRVSRPQPLAAVRAQELAGQFTMPVRAMSPLALGSIRDELARALQTVSVATRPAVVPSVPQIVTSGATTGAAQRMLLGRHGFAGLRRDKD